MLAAQNAGAYADLSPCPYYHDSSEFTKQPYLPK